MNATINYLFAHKLLPFYVREREELLLENYFVDIEEVPNRFSFYINSLFKSLCVRERKIEKEKEKEFASKPVLEVIDDYFSEHIYSDDIFSGDFCLAVVKMPEPKSPTDAKYVLFAFDLCSECKVRYFTYELGQSFNGEKEFYFTCEWTKTGTHRNYGSFEDSSLECFVNRVKEVLR